MNEKKQFTQEDLEQILGGTTGGTTTTCGTIESDKLSDPSKAYTTTGASRTGAQQAAVSDNLT